MLAAEGPGEGGGELGVDGAEELDGDAVVDVGGALAKGEAADGVGGGDGGVDGVGRFDVGVAGRLSGLEERLGVVESGASVGGGAGLASPGGSGGHAAPRQGERDGLPVVHHRRAGNAVPRRPPFYDVSGTQTLDWTYQYAGQHVTDVHIVKKLVDSRYGCMP